MAKRRLPQPLEPEELRAVLAIPNRRAPTGCRNRAMLTLMAAEGLRVGEVVGLRLSDLSRRRDRIRVINGKGGDRTVYLTEATSGRIAEWLAVRGKLAPDSAWLFPQVRLSSYRNPGERSGAKLRGSKLSTSYVRALTARLGAKAGLPEGRRTNPHVFRHTAATAMVEGGFELPEVQAQLGHRNIATTSVYLHVRNARLASRMRQFQPEGIAD